MATYKPGDKFVIEIDSVMTNKNGTLYGIKGFKSLVFDEYGLSQLEKEDVDMAEMVDLAFRAGTKSGTYEGMKKTLHLIKDYVDGLILIPKE